jgi:hypothetical protein
MAVQHRGTNWTPEEDRRLLDLIEAGKSWVFISANLKRPVKTIRDRISQMRRSGLKAKGKWPECDLSRYRCPTSAAFAAGPLDRR